MNSVNYPQVVELVERLSEEQQSALIAHLLLERARRRPLSAEEKIHLLEVTKLDNIVNQTPSIRREDWYGDDGR